MLVSPESEGSPFRRAPAQTPPAPAGSEARDGADLTSRSHGSRTPRNGRRVAGVAGPGGAAAAGGRERAAGAAPRRDGNGEGAGRPRAPRALPAAPAGVRRDRKSTR